MGAAGRAERVRPSCRSATCLVHWVDAGEVGDAKEEARCLERHGLVALPRELDDLLRLGRDGDLLLDGVGRDLARAQRLDQHLVVQDVALGGREEGEDLILNVLQRLLVLGVRKHELLALNLQVGGLLLNHDAKPEVCGERKSGGWEGGGQRRRVFAFERALATGVCVFSNMRPDRCRSHWKRRMLRVCDHSVRDGVGSHLVLQPSLRRHKVHQVDLDARLR